MNKTKYISLFFGFLLGAATATSVAFTELLPMSQTIHTDETAHMRQTFVKRYEALDGDIESVYRTFLKRDDTIEEVLKLRLQLQIHEGRKSRVYKDSLGLLTVGVGHLVQVGDTVQPSSIEALLFEDMLKALHIAKVYVGENTWNSLSLLRQRTLIDLGFNLGSRLYEFKKAKAAIIAGDFKSAAAEFRGSKWCTQTKTRCTAITHMLETNSDYYKF